MRRPCRNYSCGARVVERDLLLFGQFLATCPSRLQNAQIGVGWCRFGAGSSVYGGYLASDVCGPSSTLVDQFARLGSGDLLELVAIRTAETGRPLPWKEPR